MKHRHKRIMKELYECKNPMTETLGVGTTVKIDLCGWLRVEV